MMQFYYDEQTLLDLELFKSHQKEQSIYDLFKITKTLGGRVRLKYMMQNPTFDKNLLERRVQSIRFLHAHDFRLNITNQHIDFIDHYLNSGLLILKNNQVDIFAQKIKNSIVDQENFYIISTGVKYATFSLNSIFNLAHDMKKYDDLPAYIRELVDEVMRVSQIKEIADVFAQIGSPDGVNDTKLDLKKIFRLDNLYRDSQLDNLRAMIDVIFEFDALIAIAQTAKKYELSFPIYLDSDRPKLEIKQLFHPFIESPVKNDFYIHEKNFCFLTGSNMAGKSTLLKSISLIIYLAHIGFPVPAAHIKTSVFDGLFTTINLSDNLNLGYSHFLNEVKRVKEAALQLQKGKQYFIVFDELFKGTNVKDAFEASLLIIKALAKITSSVFIISTHLLEIADEINTEKNISFRFLETTVKDNLPIFSYRLQQGVSKNRLGMTIVKNEGIIDILNRIQ